MKSIKRFCTFLLLTAGCLTATADLDNLSFPEELEAGPVNLVKIGEGTLRWVFLRVYDGVLYLDSEKPNADPLSDVAKRLELAYSVEISAEDFRQSGNEILKRNVDPTTFNALQTRLDQLNAAYKNVNKGDRYSLTYIPGEGTTLALNGDPLVTIMGADFAKAYFSIWLGEEPAAVSFRRDLLGN